MKSRLRHERDRVARGARDVLHDVLVEHQLVGHARELVEAHVDLGLPRGTNFVVLHLDRDPDQLEDTHHLGAQVLELVHRRDREVALLVARLVREVGASVELALATRVPHALDRVEEVVARELVLIEARGVEDVELGFRSEVCGVGEPGRLQIRLGFGDDVARITAVRLARERVAHEAVDVERGVLAERVDDRRCRVGDQEHVGFLDLLESADRRTVETQAVLEHLLLQLVRGDREVLHQPRKVTEPNVDDIDAGVLDELEDIAGRAIFHIADPFVRRTRECGRERTPRSLARRPSLCSRRPWSFRWSAVVAWPVRTRHCTPSR